MECSRQWFNRARPGRISSGPFLSQSFDAHPEALQPLILDVMDMKGDFERRDDSRFGAMFRMTLPEGGVRIVPPLSLKSRLVVAGLLVRPARNGDAVDLGRKFEAWCEAILRANGEEEPGINGRKEPISPAGD